MHKGHSDSPRLMLVVSLPNRTDFADFVSSNPSQLDTPERKDSFIELTKPLTSLRKSDLDDIALAKDPRVIDLREVNVHTMHTMVRPFIDRKGEGGTWSREYSLSVSLMDREMGDGFGKRFYDILATPNGSFRTQEKEEGRRGIDVVKKEQQWA